MEGRHPIVDEDLRIITSQQFIKEELRDKTILITGAAGFLPAYMVETILYLNEFYGSNNRIIAVVRNLNRAKARFSLYENRKDLQFKNLDLSNPILVDEKVDYIIHAASQASPKYYGEDPVGTMLPNIIGTYNLLNLAVEKKIKGFLFFSSGEVYGQVPENQIPIKESTFGYLDPTHVRSCYAESKRAGETLCVSYFAQYGVPIKIVRPFHTYGPGLRFDDGRVFADFIADIVNGRDIVLKSDGSAIRPFCYLTDAVTGFFSVLIKGENGEAYNIGNSNEEISVKDLAQTLVDLFPLKNLKVVFNIDKTTTLSYLKSPIFRNSPDTTKALSLGWQPYVSIKEGFGRAIESFT